MGEQAVEDAIDHYFSSLTRKTCKACPRRATFTFSVMGNNTVYEWKTADDLFTWFQSHVLRRMGYSELDELTLENLMTINTTHRSSLVVITDKRLLVIINRFTL